MLKNNITDEDLKAYAPNLSVQIWPGRTSYAPQIAEAFRIAIGDLRTAGFDTRTLGAKIPVTAEGIEGRDGFNRFTVTVGEN